MESPGQGRTGNRREATYVDDIIQKDHIQRKLLENPEGIDTVFDDGAGSGRFSILLAKQGCRVTHFDISQPMIEKAQELAAKEGVLDDASVEAKHLVIAQLVDRIEIRKNVDYEIEIHWRMTAEQFLGRKTEESA